VRIFIYLPLIGGVALFRFSYDWSACLVLTALIGVVVVVHQDKYSRLRRKVGVWALLILQVMAILLLLKDLAFAGLFSLLSGAPATLLYWRKATR
jgi:hypothetical protein